MFRNRKKSQAKRPDDQRDRDNSRVLDRYSDTVDTSSAAPTLPPVRRESLPAGNFQYLKLTDGFNIVFTSGSADPAPASHKSSSDPSSSPSPPSPQTPPSANKRNDSNGDKTDKIQTPVTDVLTHDRELDTPQQEEDFSSQQTEYVNIGSLHTAVNTPSVQQTRCNTSPKDAQGEPPDLSSDRSGMSTTQRSDTCAPSANIPSKTGHRAISPTVSKDLSPPVDHPVVKPSADSNSAQEYKQNDKDIVHADNSTSKTRGDDEWEQENILENDTPENEYENLCGERGRGSSNKPDQSTTTTVISPLEDDDRADAERARSHFDVYDNITVAESGLVSRASNEAVGCDQELNNYTGTRQHACVTTTTTTPGSLSVTKLRDTDTEVDKTTEKSDTAETTGTQSELQQTISPPGDSPVWRVRSRRQPEAGERVTQAAEASRGLNENSEADHVNIGESGQTNAFRHTVIGAEPKRNSKPSGDVSETDKRHTVADMLRLNRHNISSPKKEPTGKPEVYRQLKDKAETTDDKNHHTSTSDTLHNPPPPPPSTLHIRPDPTDAPAHPPPPVLSPRSKRPPALLPKPQKKSPLYENWTINQAVTRVVVDSNEDEEDDADEVNHDHGSPAGSLDRCSVPGSKDSGLCVDAVRSDAAVLTTDRGKGNDATAATSSVQQQQKEEDGEGEKEEEEEGGGDEGDRIRDDEGEEKNEVDCEVVPSVVTVFEEDSAVYENTVVPPPRLRHDGDSGAATPDVPDSPETGRLTPSMAIRRHHDNHSLTSTTSEEDHRHNFSMSGDSSFEEGHEDEEQVPLAAAARENMLKMRQLLVSGVLETEKTYLAILELLLHYKRTLEASCRTSQPVLSEEDIGNVFSNLQDLLDIHKQFVEGLQAKVDSWGPERTVGDVFMFLVEKFPKFGSYAENYQTAVATIHRCSHDNHRFQDLAQQIVLTSTTREVTSLEDALFKPVQRLQRNTLVLYDLIKHTPKDHPDYETLQEALHLSQQNLENFGTSLVPRHGKGEQKGDLLKSSFLVELVGVSRKLRYIFLFSDVLVCTKREQANRSGEVTFDCKWFIPLSELQMDTKFTYQDDMKFSKRDEIEDLKKKLHFVKTELKKELNKDEIKDRQRPVTSLVPSRTVEKLQRKAKELEGQLILASPRLPFKVSHEAGKAHTFLMTTDYERQEWRELLLSLKQQTTSEVDTVPLNAFGVQEMVNSVRGLPEINEIGSVLIETEEEVVYGTLNVTVHKLTGLNEPCDTYCCLEMDSYGHFFMKARTHISSSTCEPSWNADFELDLEGSQTLRVLCYKKGTDKKGDILLCRGALEITKSWLKGTFQEKIVTMNEYSLVLSVCCTATEKTLRRTPVKQSSTAVFGVPIYACATREGKTVPTIVTVCVQEVEKRGMKETGIYRVSGVTSDVQRLKKHFDKSVKLGVSSLGDMDIHTVTSLLKLYLRELPDPVFTEASYPNFLDALKLTDKEGKEKCMLSLFYNLPDINYYTAVYMLEHLLRISRLEADNKMSIHNLSTIFGPTLLAPAPEKMAASITELMTLGAEHCMKQSQVVFFYLGLLARGASLRRSSAAEL